MQGASGVAEITYVASAQTQTSSTGTTLVINKPAGTQQGDLMISFVVAVNKSGTWTGGTGWTEVIDQGVDPSLRVAYLVAGASEPSSYTFAFNALTTFSGVIATFRNAAYDTVGTISTTASGGLQTAPQITLSTSSSAILAFFENTNLAGWTNPTPGLVSTATDSDGNSPSWALYRELNLSSGATGTRSATCSSTGSPRACILVGIKPA